METPEELSKKERIRIKHEEERRLAEALTKSRQRYKWLGAGIIILTCVALGIWIFRTAYGPTPGQSFESEGRDHVKPGTKVEYKTNPPTSGSHYEVWEKPGVYSTPLLDEKLVHSLEHGYIIISYNCDIAEKKAGLIQPVFAQEPTLSESPIPYEPATPSATLAKWSHDPSCKSLVQQLSDYATSVKLWKLIVVPRPNMDARIIMTAWSHMEKFNTMNTDEMKKFIDAYRDHGPEQTMEP